MSEGDLEMPPDQRARLKAALDAGAESPHALTHRLRGHRIGETPLFERLAAHLRDRLDAGETVTTTARRLAEEMGENSRGVAQALITLRDDDPEGLTVQYGERWIRPQEWTIERVENREKGDGGGSS